MAQRKDPLMTFTSNKALLIAMHAQIDWMEQHGTDEEGYVQKYGSASDPEHYGDGGEAIFQADFKRLVAICRTPILKIDPDVMAEYRAAALWCAHRKNHFCLPDLLSSKCHTLINQSAEAFEWMIGRYEEEIALQRNPGAREEYLSAARFCARRGRNLPLPEFIENETGDLISVACEDLINEDVRGFVELVRTIPL